MRVEKQESSHHMPIAELGKEKVFPPGGKKYKKVKLGEGVGFADERGAQED